MLLNTNVLLHMVNCIAGQFSVTLYHLPDLLIFGHNIFQRLIDHPDTGYHSSSFMHLVGFFKT